MLSRARRDLTMAESARGPFNARLDHLLVAEMIEPRREGFLLDPDDTDAWARALRALAEDRGTLSAMSRAALVRYRAHATWREAAGAAAAFIEGRLQAAGAAARASRSR